LVVTGEAKQFIADTSYSPVYGARPVKRYLQKHIETEVGRMIIKGDIIENSEILVDLEGDGLKITNN
jgi:ATP-dependent Clp protease ATP-binding subunit ClpB